MKNWFIPVVLSAPEEAAFSPLDYSPSLWLDASDSSSVTVVDEIDYKVSQWDDKSGNGNHVSQSTGASQPIYNATTNAIEFDGTNDRLIYSPIVSNGDSTVFIVLKRTGSGSQIPYNEGISSIRHGFIISDTDVSFLHSSGYSPVTVSSSSDAPIVLYGYRDGTTLYVDHDGNSATNENGEGFTATKAAIGTRCDSSTQSPFSGDIYELLVFDYALTAPEISAIESYLTDKWIPIPLQYSPSLWLDASDSSSVTVVDEIDYKVSQWDDKSGNERHVTQGNGASQPAYNTTTNYIDFPGYIRTTNLPYIDPPYTLFVLCTSDSGAIAGRMHNINGRNDYILSNAIYLRNTDIFTDGSGSSGGESKVLTYVASSSSSRILYENGTQVAEITEDVTLEQGVYFNMGLRLSAAGEAYTGSIAEVIAFDRELSASEIAAVESYLTGKWL